jgi:hypothetical protein
LSSIFCESLIFPVCVDAAGYRSIQLQGAWMLSKANRLHATTTETPWAYIRAKYYHLRRGVWKYEHLAVQWTPYNGCTFVRFPTPGGACGVEGGMADFRTTTRRAAPTSPPEKGCFAAYDVRSINELSGRTTGRLGDFRPDTAHSIGGTAELALR